MLQSANTETSGCPACRGFDTTPFGSDGDSAIQKCTACGATFFDRPLTQINDYTGYYDYMGYLSGPRIAEEAQVRLRQNRAKFAAIEKYGPQDRRVFLDVGAGPGYFANYAKLKGADCSAVELNTEARTAGETAFGLAYTTLDQVAPASVDVLTLFHVLEHIEDPNGFVETLASKLKPGGLFFLQMPTHESASSCIEYNVKRLLGRKQGRKGSLYLPDHVTGFTAKGIATLLKRHGFEVARIKGVNFFDREYDPWYVRFNWRSPRFWKGFPFEMARGIIDTLAMNTDRSAWLSVLARKTA